MHKLIQKWKFVYFQSTRTGTDRLKSSLWDAIFQFQVLKCGREEKWFLSKFSLQDSWPTYIPQLLEEWLHGINSSVTNSRPDELSPKNMRLYSKLLRDTQSDGLQINLCASALVHVG